MQRDTQNCRVTVAHRTVRAFGTTTARWSVATAAIPVLGMLAVVAWLAFARPAFAVPSGPNQAQVEYWRMEGDRALARQDYEKAIENWQRASSYLPVIQDDETRAELNIKIGNSYYQLRRFDEAQRYVGEAQRYYDAHHLENLGAAVTEVTLAEILHCGGKLQNAVEHQQRGVNLLRKLVGVSEALGDQQEILRLMQADVREFGPTITVERAAELPNPTTVLRQGAL